ncbi:MAG: hypothetical protein ACI97A_003556 [Planctomycetota bacterium]
MRIGQSFKPGGAERRGIYVFRWTSQISLLLGGLVLGLLGACGESEGELIVQQRREPRTLLQQGTALTEAESTRRKDAQEAARSKAQAEQKLLKAISKLNGAKSVDAIVESLDRFRISGPKAAQYFSKIEPFIKHKDADVRATALDAMSAVDPEAAYRHQRAALEDEVALVRRKAVVVWSKHRPDDVGSLLSLLNDDDARVQYEVIQALGAGKPDAETLSRVAKSVEDLDGSSAKAALILILPRRQEVSEFGTMVEYLLDHQDETTRLKTAETLRKSKVMSDQIAIKVAQTILEDPSPSVRRSCYAWLKALCSKPLPQFDPDADDATRMESYDELLAFVKGLKGTWGQ